MHFTTIIVTLAAGLAAARPSPSPQYGVNHSGGTATYYYPAGSANAAAGVYGACGWANANSESVAALPHAFFDQYTPNGNPNLNPLCGHTVRIWRNVNGVTKSVDAKVVDRLPEGTGNDIDLSEPVFKALGQTSEGRFAVDWMVI